MTGACALGWLVQLRFEGGRIDARIRGATHLVYFFFMVYLQKLIGLATGLVLADLLFQSILQAEPIIPALVEAIGRPELARGILERTLMVEERYDLQWVYVGISVGLLLATTPLRVMCGGGEYSWIMYGTGAGWYRIWILQRINQDLRTALVERWHALSLNYHSDHRTGDSIFRIYQDSAQVTAVIDRLMGVSMTIFGYFVGVFLLSLLSPWLGLIMLAVVAPTLMWAKWAMPRMRTRALVARAATSDVTSSLQESFGALRLIKAYGAEDRVQRRLESESVILFNAAYRVRVLMALVGIITFSIVAVALLGSEVPHRPLGVPRRGDLLRGIDRLRRFELRDLEPGRPPVVEGGVPWCRLGRAPGHVAVDVRPGHRHGPETRVRHPRSRTGRRGRTGRCPLDRHPPGSAVSTTSVSPTSRIDPYCGTSVSPPAPATSPPSSVPPDRARARSWGCCCVSTTRTPAASPSTASTCAATRWTRSGETSPSRCRRTCCSPCRYATTSATWRLRRRMKRSWRRFAFAPWRTTSTSFRTDSIPCSATVADGFPPASASACRSPAPWFATRRC